MHPRSRTVRAVGWLSALVALATCAWIIPSNVGATSLTSGREFDYPSGLVFAAGHLWVTNEHGNSVSEINPSNGAWMASLTSGPYGIDAPSAIATNGPDIFVANSVQSISEVNASTRQLVRIVFGSAYHFSKPVAITVAGGRVLVLNAGSGVGSITEFSAQNGLPLTNISGSQFAFDDPVAFATNGPDVYVADKGNNSVTEVNMVTGQLIDVISQQGLSQPDGIAIEDGRVWVADSQSNAATEINAANDAVLATFTDTEAKYGFGDPSTVIADAGNVYIATPYGTSPMVTKVEATTGTPDWFMCNTNGPYYFSELSAFAVQGNNLWVASRSGANSKTPAAATGSLTEMNVDSGALIATYPAPPGSTSTTTTTSTTATTTTTTTTIP
ncbi:MAG: hypothetical protein WCF63_03235 [Acidimicrobiales bacterium]